MFSSRGLFRDIACPGQYDCALPNCLFKHDNLSIQDNSNDNQIYDPATLPSISPPQSPRSRKRIKLDLPEPSHEHDIPSDHSSSRGGTPSVRTIRNSSSAEVQFVDPPLTTRIVNDSKTNASEDTPGSDQLSNGADSVKSKQPATVTRPVSPPTSTRVEKNSVAPAKPYRKPTNTRGLVPRSVKYPPAKLEVRAGYLKKLYKQIEEANDRYKKQFPDRRRCILNKAELETQAMDDEERIANSHSNHDVYRKVLAERVKFYMLPNMTAQIWEQTVKTTWLVDPNVATHQDTLKQAPQRVESGLDSVEKEITVLKQMRTGLHQYAQYGYVTKQPSEKAIADAKKVREGSFGNLETCDRCGSRFSVFPGRNKAGELTTAGPCTYHWARSTGTRGKGTYACCGQSTDSRGCTEAKHHVFKVSDPARLALLLPFKETPQHRDQNRQKPGAVVFDCEMCYTTLGLELVRLTALSWPTHKTLLDVLVRPIGEILDMNTRFSGVTFEMLSNAKDYGLVPRPKYEPGDPLQRVASPAAAREFLFDLIDPDTPLIGHAIENDLNACRIIHPFVIDTVLLYPHPKGMPVRHKLKDLTRVHLGRTIQVSGAEGHDSKEDSIATGDLVLKKVGEKWQELKKQGFYFGESGLIRGKAS